MPHEKEKTCAKCGGTGYSGLYSKDNEGGLHFPPCSACHPEAKDCEKCGNPLRDRGLATCCEQPCPEAKAGEWEKVTLDNAKDERERCMMLYYAIKYERESGKGIDLLMKESAQAEQRGRLSGIKEMASRGREAMEEIKPLAAILQKSLCCYLTTEGDKRTCDCKFARGERLKGRLSEETGCCEARKILWIIAAHDQALKDLSQ